MYFALVLTFMLFIRWIRKSYRDQNEEDEERPSDFHQQLQL